MVSTGEKCNLYQMCRREKSLLEGQGNSADVTRPGKLMRKRDYQGGGTSEGMDGERKLWEERVNVRCLISHNIGLLWNTVVVQYAECIKEFQLGIRLSPRLPIR